MTDSEVVTPKLSKLAGIDKELFNNRTPSKELEAMRWEWDKEFEKRLSIARKGRR